MAADRFTAANPVTRRMRRISKREQREEALAFLADFAREQGLSPVNAKSRRKAVLTSLRQSRHYRHTSEELAYGARVAWRNHARCIGRLWWKSLEVVDCRAAETPAEVAALVFDHMRRVYAKGHIRSCVSVFAPATAGRVPVTIESPQVIQYAGYLGEDGTVLGDTQNVELTRTVIALGWQPPRERGAWDVLPLLLRDAAGHRQIFEVPRDLINEVQITHPDYPDLAELNLKWYAVPCVTNMHLTIGGIEYPCAPFNGHYMGSEIASRDLADIKRYNVLPEVGRAMGLSVSANADPLWRDRALTELNHAVLASYRQAGVHIVDHHTASSQFMEFVKNEQRDGRTVSGDWAWIVPPQASAGCPVFHLGMQNLNAVPNFFASRATDGNSLRVDRTDQRRNIWLRRYDVVKRQFRDWRRQRDDLWSR